MSFVIASFFEGFSFFLLQVRNVTRPWVQPTECVSQESRKRSCLILMWCKIMHLLRMLPMLWGFCTFKTWFPSWKFFRIHICELDIGRLCLKSWQIWPWAKMESRTSHLVRWAVRHGTVWKWTWESWSIEGTAWRIALSFRWKAAMWNLGASLPELLETARRATQEHYLQVSLENLKETWGHLADGLQSLQSRSLPHFPYELEVR